MIDPDGLDRNWRWRAVLDELERIARDPREPLPRRRIAQRALQEVLRPSPRPVQGGLPVVGNKRGGAFLRSLNEERGTNDA